MFFSLHEPSVKGLYELGFLNKKIHFSPECKDDDYLFQAGSCLRLIPKTIIQ